MNDNQAINVLIIDDDYINRRLIHMLVSANTHFNIIGEVGSAEEALEFCRYISPDVVITDYNLPGINGIEMSRAIKRLSPQTPVLMMSASYSEPGIEQAAKQAGVHTFLHKPVRADLLQSALAEVTGF